MTPNDKNYVDRLHNQHVNELNEIKNRLLILEGKLSAMSNGNIRVEIDTDKVYEMFLKACHDCQQQRQERHQEEDRQAEDRLQQECEAKGEPYYNTDAEMRIAIVKEFNTFYRLIITFIKRTEEHYKLIHSDIISICLRMTHHRVLQERLPSEGAFLVIPDDVSCGDRYDKNA